METKAEAYQPDSMANDCIDQCLECARSCMETVNYCLNKGGKHAAAHPIVLLLNCVSICKLAADFMLSGSHFVSPSIGLCAEVCERCARDCEKFGEDEDMKVCAGLCRACAKCCKEMAGKRM